MYLFKKILFFFVLIYSFTPLVVFGMCEHVFTELGLSNRSNNILYDAGIRTIEALKAKTEEELKKLPGFGKKSLREVQVVLAEREQSLAYSSDSTHVNSLGLSTRSKNIFYDEGIRTIEELKAKTAEELMRLPGFGKKSLREVKALLAERGQGLADSSDTTSINSLGLLTRFEKILYNEGIHTIEALKAKTEEELMRLPGFSRKSLRKVKAVLAERGQSLAHSSNFVSISSLGFSTRIENIFYDEGIYTIEALKAKTEEDLMELPGFGKKFLREVKAVLAERGQGLADSSDTTSINSLGLLTRFEKILYNEGIHTIEALKAKTEEELMRLPGFGEKFLREVKEALFERGWRLSSVSVLRI